MRLMFLVCGLLAISTPLLAKKHDHSDDGMKNAVILIIRHGEKPATGTVLSPAGEQRAQAYVEYFKNFSVDSKPLKLDYLIATADTTASSRPRLTIEPLSKALGLPIDDRFQNNECQKLADAIRKKPPGKTFLLCWHHGEIPQLIHVLGANPGEVLPDKKWPDDVFGWVVQLRYDAEGHLMEAKRINEKLMPDDQIRTDQ